MNREKVNAKLRQMEEIIDPNEIEDGDTWAVCCEAHLALRALADERILDRLDPDRTGGDGPWRKWPLTQIAQLMVAEIATVVGPWWWNVPQERAVEEATEVLSKANLNLSVSDFSGDVVWRIVGAPDRGESASESKAPPRHTDPRAILRESMLGRQVVSAAIAILEGTHEQVAAAPIDRSTVEGPDAFYELVAAAAGVDVETVCTVLLYDDDEVAAYGNGGDAYDDEGEAW
jgi:hypothetical protein